MSVYVVQVCVCVVSRRMEGKHTYIIGMKMRWATIDDGATISFMLQKINLKKNWSLIKILICKKISWKLYYTYCWCLPPSMFVVGRSMNLYVYKHTSNPKVEAGGREVLTLQGNPKKQTNSEI